MEGVWSSVGVFALGGVGWWVTSFIGRPFREFFDLRREVIHKSVLYSNVAAAQRESPDGSVTAREMAQGELDRLREAQGVFRDLAARMRAFALNELPAVWLVKKLGYDPMTASTRLIRVSNNLETYGRGRHDAAEALQKVLRFRTTAS
jgi:hypothetical protein